MPRRCSWTLEPALAQLFGRQAGLARRSQLALLGIDSDHVAARLAAGKWQLVAPEVVSADNGRLDAEQQRWRAVLHPPEPAWLSHLSALEQHGLQGWAPVGVHVLTSRRQRPLPLSGVVVHQSARAPGAPSALTRGMPMVSAARATVDSASGQPHPRLAAALVVACLQQRLVTASQIDEELLGCGRIRHKVAIRDALRAAGQGVDSLAEDDVVALVRRAGLPEPRRQAVIAGRRRDLVVDLPDGTLLVVEVDGPQHDDPRARWVDAQRDAEIAALGHLVLRLPAFAVRPEAARMVAQLRTIARNAELRRRAS